MRVASLRRAALLCAALLAASTAGAAERHLEGQYANGARWAIDVPADWNGTLLLFARGYSPGPESQAPATAPRGTRDWLLAQGYALAASSYSGAGWALQEAPADQLDVLATFRQSVGAARRTIAWGTSMGGLVSVALAEREAAGIDGALALCGSVSGSLGMLNTALDGAFAFRTLLAANDDVRVVRVDDDAANAGRVQRVLEAALRTPQGRARVALAAALAQLPYWSDPEAPEPAPRDYDAQAEEAFKSFVRGVFLPRTDQERRAGGVTSWNTGIDYRVQLRRSGRDDFVRDLYRRAGLDLDADLAALDAAPRIAADPHAVAYLRANYVPSGRLRVPLLVMQTVGDGLTVPATHGSLRELVRRAGRAALLGELYVHGAGHCTFNLAEHVAALRTLEARLDQGRWRTAPRVAGGRIDASVTGPAPRFTAWRPTALTRTCDATGPCEGEPTPVLPPPVAPIPRLGRDAAAQAFLETSKR